MSALARTNQDRLRVAHVVLSLDVGGLERVVLDLARAGRSLGQQSLIVCLERPGALAAEAARFGVHVVSLSKPPGLRPALVVRLRSALRQLRPQVIHTHQITALLYAGPAARLAGVPVVVHTEHGKNYAPRRRTRWVGRLAGAWAETFFGVSEDIVEEVRGLRVVASRKLRFAPNGIDPAPFAVASSVQALKQQLGIPVGDRIIGTVGRLAEIKCQDVLLRGFARVARVRDDVRLLLVGDGPSRTALETLAEQLGVRPQVRFVGYQARPQDYLQLMDLFALTSRSEGMPLTVLEAWAARVPVVATRVGGLPRLIDHARTGWLIPPFDEAALASALLQLLADDAMRKRLIDAGQREVQTTYHLDAMAEH
ncbi:MAG: glycosyltransferase, partial [Candidatus Saccharimonadales bacterium]